MRMALILLSLLWPLLSDAAWAMRDNSVEQEIVRGIELLYDSETDAAEEIFRRIRDRNPNDPAGHFYMAMVTWSRLSTGFWSHRMVDQYIERIDRTISVARGIVDAGKADSYTYFYLGGALGFKGRFYLMEHKWLTSFNLAVDAVDALKTCQTMDPSNKDVLLGLGIFDYYTARLSGFLKFITFLLVHKGDRAGGPSKTV